MAAGASAIFQKPIDTLELMATIQECLGEKAQVW
jgi:hypothetical protein